MWSERIVQRVTENKTGHINTRTIHCPRLETNCIRRRRLQKRRCRLYSQRRRLDKRRRRLYRITAYKKEINLIQGIIKLIKIKEKSPDYRR